MKLIVCGKGGCGKSTISALLAMKFCSLGYRVLLIDADESNFGLHRMVGIPTPVHIMDSLGGKKGFKEKINKPFPDTDRPFSRKLKIDELPEDCVQESGGIKLAVIGKVHGFGEGCACPMGLLSRMVLASLIIEKNDMVIIDTEAGTEHFGRQVDAECDLIIGVIDPTYESILLAEKMEGMAKSAGKDIVYVLNKTGEQIIDDMTKQMDPQKVWAAIPQNEAIFTKNLKGDMLELTVPEIDRFCHKIQETGGLL